MYNYEIKHVKGEANCIAYCLSQRSEWLVNRHSSDNKGRTTGQSDEVCLRIITESRHILKDNP